MASAGGQYPCDDCGESFSDVRNLITHIQSHTYRCKYCNRRFTSRTKFVEHVELHDAVHECPVCREMFRSRKEMVSHKRSHQAKPTKWTCKICQQSCKSEANLTHHMARHGCRDEETAETADNCEDDTKKAIDLRLWPCPICSKMFKKKGNLIKHQKLHEEQAEPIEEDKVLSDQNEEQEVEEDMATEKPMDLRIWACENCPKTFKKKGNLKIHMMKHHFAHEVGDVDATESEEERNGADNLAIKVEERTIKEEDQVNVGDESEVFLEVEPNEVGMMDSEDDRNASFDQGEAVELTASV